MSSNALLTCALPFMYCTNLTSRPEKEKTEEVTPASDTFDLGSRFCASQKTGLAQALEELKAGQKQGAWAWYVFPAGKEKKKKWGGSGGAASAGSFSSSEYCLRDQPPNEDQAGEAAKAYLKFQFDGVDLRANLIATMSVVAEQLEGGAKAKKLVGSDEQRLRSSLKLFEEASKEGFDDEVHAVCTRALAALDGTKSPGGKRRSMLGGRLSKMLSSGAKKQ